MDTNRNLGNRSHVGDRSVGDKMEEGWDRFRSRVRSKWGDLTDRDLDQYRGRRREDLSGFIGERTGARREEVDRDLDVFARDTGYRFQ